MYVQYQLTEDAPSPFRLSPRSPNLTKGLVGSQCKFQDSAIRISCGRVCGFFHQVPSMHLSQQLVDPGCPYSLGLATPHAQPVHYAGIAWLKDCSRPQCARKSCRFPNAFDSELFDSLGSPPPEIQWTETHTPSLHSLFSGARSSTTTPIHIPGGHHGPLGRMAHSPERHLVPLLGKYRWLNPLGSTEASTKNKNKSVSSSTKIPIA